LSVRMRSVRMGAVAMAVSCVVQSEPLETCTP
jgi:hypothetical protein